MLSPAERALNTPAAIEDMDWASRSWTDLFLRGRPALPFASQGLHLLDDDPNKRDAVSRAASLIAALAEIAAEIAAGQFAPDLSKGEPLDMEMYRRTVFSAERIPGSRCDQQVCYPFGDHVVVAVGGGFWRLPIREGGRAASADSIARTLAAIIDQSRRQPTPPHEQVGQGTALPRDLWAGVRAVLSAELASREALLRIGEALLVVALEADCVPAGRCEAIERALQGNLRNRWFDKSMQLVVFQNGQALTVGEHSLVDGMVMSRLSSEAQRRAVALQVGASAEALSTQRLRFTVPPRAAEILAGAEPFFEDQRRATVTKIVDWVDQGHGRWRGSRLGRDAAVQLAVQRAALRALGELPSINGTVGMRHFRHGRVDLYYSVTPASADLVQAPLGRDAASAARLHAASLAHQQNVAACRRGEGVYNHFIALLAAQPEGTGLRASFQGLHLGTKAVLRDRGYSMLMGCRISTSNLGAWPGLDIACVGNFSRDVINVIYSFKPDGMTIHLKAGGSLRSALPLFCSELSESLDLLFQTAELLPA